MDQEKEQQYQQMRGEYLGLMASLEYNLTFLLYQELGITRYDDAFYRWFMEVPVPFASKISLFEQMYQGDSILRKFGGLGKRFRELQDFRNILAHSFIEFERARTARGKDIPQHEVSSETLTKKLKALRRIEKYINDYWFDKFVGPMDGGVGPISADDY